MPLSKRRIAAASAIAASLVLGTTAIAVAAGLGQRDERSAAVTPPPVATFEQIVPSEGKAPAQTEPPSAGADARSYGGPESVPGAFEVSGAWFVPCDSIHAVTPSPYPAIGCQIAGFEEELPSLIAPEITAQQPASASDQATAVAFVRDWVAYDSTADQADRTARLAQAAPAADLPDVPELGWKANQDAYGDLGYRAFVELTGEPRVSSSVARDLGSEVTVEAPFLARYTAAVDCPWGEVGPAADDGSCALGHYAQPALWTVYIEGGLVTAIFEPEIIAG